MSTDEWLTLTQASLKIGKNQRYLSNIKNRNPEYYEGVEIKKMGGIYLIKESDISMVLSRLKRVGKKRGDRLKTSVLERSTKQKMPFCFYPLPILSFSC